jgi:hypothetical protein
MENMEHVSNSPINSYGAKVDTLLATCLRTWFGKSKLVSLLRKFSEKENKKATSLKYEFGNSPFLIIQEMIEIPPHDSNLSIRTKSKTHFMTFSKNKEITHPHLINS